MVRQLKTNPDSRRIIVSAWNVAELPKMALLPCHAFFQFYVADGRLSCQLYQRSADIFLGVPFNIASYALLTHMLAQQCDLGVGDFIWTGGDCHIYANHAEQVELQLARAPLPYPRLHIKRKPASIFDYEYEDFEVIDYRAASGDQGTGRRLSSARDHADPHRRRGAQRRHRPRQCAPVAAARGPGHFKPRHARRAGDHGAQDLGFAARRLPPAARAGATSSSRAIRNGGPTAPSAAHSLDAALALAADAPRVFVGGGAELYALALPRADELLLTEIDRDFDGDTRFPAWDRGAFVETARETHHAGPPNDFDYAFVSYRRRRDRASPGLITAA